MVKDNSSKILFSYVIGYFLLNIGAITYILIFNRFGTLENAAINLLFYLFMAVVVLRLSKSYLKSQLANIKRDWKSLLFYIFIGVGMIFAASILVSIIYGLIDFNETSDNQDAWNTLIDSGTFGVVATILSSIVFAPIVEEIVFRYAGFGVLKIAFRDFKYLPLLQIVITSLAFGLVHVLSDNILQILFYSGLGAVLGYIYYKSKNIFVPITIHLLWNLFGVLYMILA